MVHNEHKAEYCCFDLMFLHTNENQYIWNTFVYFVYIPVWCALSIKKYFLYISRYSVITMEKKYHSFSQTPYLPTHTPPSPQDHIVPWIKQREKNFDKSNILLPLGICICICLDLSKQILMDNFPEFLHMSFLHIHPGGKHTEMYQKTSAVECPKD